VAFTDRMQFFHRSPAGGRWTAVLVLNSPANGQNLEEPFTGTIGFAPAGVVATGLPSSPATVLPAGTPVTATIQVANAGVSQKAYFVDPRLSRRGTGALLGLTPTTVTLPLAGGSPPPIFLTPPDSDQLVVAAVASDQVQMDVVPNFGSPDVEGFSFGNASIAILTAPEVAPGLWFAGPTPVGPFPDSGAPAVTAALAAVVRTSQFDRAVTSDTGDLWLNSVVSSAPFSRCSSTRPVRHRDRHDHAVRAQRHRG